MRTTVRRLRMVAGPNGSGKTTLLDEIEGTLGTTRLGVRINPDEMERLLRTQGSLDLARLQVATSTEEVRDHFAAASVLNGSPVKDVALMARCERGHLVFDGVDFATLPEASYVASALATFVRQKLLGSNVPFTFETVMSHVSKIQLLDQARACGYRTYLYFVAIDDPLINVQRVENRVKKGGHPVPREKVLERYDRCLGLLRDAIKHTDRTYLFDNSRRKIQQVAEITRTPDDEFDVEFKGETAPYWFSQALPDLI